MAKKNGQKIAERVPKEQTVKMVWVWEMAWGEEFEFYGWKEVEEITSSEELEVKYNQHDWKVHFPGEILYFPAIFCV